MAAKSDDNSLPPGFGTRPWLVQGSRGDTLTFVDVSDLSLHETVVPEVRGKTCLGCMHGDWLLMLDESTADCFLLRITTNPRTKIQLPPLHQPPLFLSTYEMLESPESANCTILVASSTEAEEECYLLHCHPGDEMWTKSVSPYDDISFSSLMRNYGGKIYDFASNLIAIDVIDGKIELQQLGTIKDEEEDSRRCGRYHIIESCGKLFLLWIDDLGCFYDDGLLTAIRVFCLNLETLSWERVEGIGNDRAFLISGTYAFSCPSIEGVLQGNCVYLVWSSCDSERLYKFCLDDMTISFHQILPQPTKSSSRAFWAIPASTQSISMPQESTIPNNLLWRKPSKDNPPNDFDEHKEDGQENSLRPWDHLPVELLELIVSNLSLVDRIRSPTVCKAWSEVLNPIEQAKVWPWLMHISKQDGTCKLFDPLRSENYNIQVTIFDTNEDRHIFRSSKDGWVLASAGIYGNDIFIINPFTEEIVEPPMLAFLYNYNGVSFSSSNPMCLDCAFFGINSSDSGKFLSTFTWQHGEPHWIEQEFEYNVSFPVGYNNPVMFDGKFYCLGRKGNLGVFDPTSNTWRILDKPEPIHVEMDLFEEDHIGREFCYLVDMDGELISVFLRNANELPRVFKLNRTEISWVEVEDIGGGALFLDYRSSYGVASPDGGNGNRIYFPRYSKDGKPVFYDMNKKTYSPSFYGVIEPLNCVWVVPNLRKNESTSED
uniref:F-box domain-containing protein n=1 Tax=Oryza nivara TaxID=4536 RepID=A0A0E0ICP6_ORYNI